MLVAADALPGRRGLLCLLRIAQQVADLREVVCREYHRRQNQRGEKVYQCGCHHVVSSFLVVLRVVYQNRRGNGVEKKYKFPIAQCAHIMI